MTIENLKNLVREGRIGISEAVWLTQKFSLSEIELGAVDNIDKTLPPLLNFLKEKKSSFNNLTIEDELYFFSIEDNIQSSIKISETLEDFDEEEEIEMDENENQENYYFESYSEKEIAKIRQIESQIMKDGHEKTLGDLIKFITDNFPKVINGFNKNEYEKAKSQFWKTQGFEKYGYFSLSPEMKKYFNDIFKSSEGVLKELIINREAALVNDLIIKFKNWSVENKIKPNKTNLKQYLRQEDIKISNSNIDRILTSIK